MINFDGIETAHQNERAASQMLRDWLTERNTFPVATIEQIEATKRGSAPFDHHQVLSWENQRDDMTANNVIVEATHLTLTEAWMYEEYLRDQGKIVGIN